MRDPAPIRAVDVLRLTTRAIPSLLFGVAVSAVVPVAIARLVDADDYSRALLVSSILIGAASGFAVDDRAAGTLASAPTVLLTRRLLRLTVVVAVIAASIALMAVLVTSGSGTTPPAGDVVAPGIASAALALAWASMLAPDGPASAGLVGTGATLLSVLLVAALATRWQWLPSLSPDDIADWYFVAVAAAVIAVVLSRDPAARPLSLRSRERRPKAAPRDGQPLRS